MGSESAKMILIITENLNVLEKEVNNREWQHLEADNSDLKEAGERRNEE
jgi:hypothetical protein